MGSSTTSGIAPINYVKSLFEQEKLPYQQGWRPSTEMVTLQTLGDMVFELYLANGADAAPEGLLVGADALKDVWEGRDPITGLLANITSHD